MSEYGNAAEKYISKLRAENEAQAKRIAELEADAADLKLALRAILKTALRAIETRDARIAELEAENAELREALKPFADIAPHYDPPENDDSDPLFDMRHFPTIGMVRAARAELGVNDGQ